MSPQRTDTTWLPDSDEVARVILDIVLSRHPALVAIEDLAREPAHPFLQQRIDEPVIHDGLLDLITSGLLH